MEPLTLVIVFGGIALYYGLYYLYTVYTTRGKHKKKKHERKK